MTATDAEVAAIAAVTIARLRAHGLLAFEQEREGNGRFGPGGGGQPVKGEGSGSQNHPVTRSDDLRKLQGQTRSNFVHPDTGAPMGKTEVGDTYEQMFSTKGAALLSDHFGGGKYERIAGETAARNVPLDAHIGDKYGVELKTMSAKSGNLKTAIKADESIRKYDACQKEGLNPLLAVQVVDQSTRTVHVYAHQGFVSKAVSQMEHVGSYKYTNKDFEKAQKATGHWDKREQRAADAAGAIAASAQEMDQWGEPIEPGDEIIEIIDGVPHVYLAGGQPLRNGNGPRNLDDHLASNPGGLTAAGRHDLRAPTGKFTTASRKLTHVDRDLRNRLHVAANMAVKRTCERAGARVVSKARTSSAAHVQVRDLIRAVPLAAVPAVVASAGLTAALGLDEQTIADREFAELHTTWDKWVSEAQRQCAEIAAKMAGQPTDHAHAATASTFGVQRESGWNLLQRRLDAQVTQLLTTPPTPLSVGPQPMEEDTDTSEQATNDNEVELDDDDMPVQHGALRMALAVAGGFGLGMTSAGVTEDGYPADPNEIVGQIGTGPIVGGYLQDNGVEPAGYEWMHGPSSRPFEPHLELDGQTFDTFTDDALAVEDDWPPTQYYHPGDHDGCSCDFVTVWSSAGGDGSGGGNVDEEAA